MYVDKRIARNKLLIVDTRHTKHNRDNTEIQRIEENLLCHLVSRNRILKRKIELVRTDHLCKRGCVSRHLKMLPAISVDWD
jgi:hypothetical protein